MQSAVLEFYLLCNPLVGAALLACKWEHCCFKCHAPNANLYHCLWDCPIIQLFWQRIRKFVTDNLTNFVPNDSSWAIFGYLDPDQYQCAVGARKLLHMVAAAGTKAILQTWLNNQAPAFRLFLDKLTFLFKMDWEDAVMHKERLTQPFFETWESFTSTLPPRIRQTGFNWWRTYIE